MLVFFYSLAAAIVSRLFTVYYPLTRKTELSARTNGRTLLACVCMNLLILVFSDALKTKETLLLFLLLVCIVDIDLMILKIPTELLLLLTVFTLRRLFPVDLHTLLLIGIALVSAAAFYLTGEKTGIGLYDILLIMLISLYALSAAAQLLFIAAVLILWGITGLIVRWYKKRGERIPLAPVIVLALALVFRLYCETVNHNT